MSKNTTTIPFSTPTALAEEIDRLANELHISRSALLTAIVSLIIKWKDSELTAKQILNSVYGKKE